MSRTRIVLGILGLALVSLAGLLLVMQPTNQRDWEFGMQTLPSLTIGHASVDVHNLRDIRWTADGGVQSADLVDRQFDVDRMQQVWFVQEPFTLPPLYGFEGVAHTYFVFDFSDQPPVAISVESRRERGQSYDALLGMLNQYELMYIWGTEEDLTGRRAVLEKNRLYMYPLTIPIEYGRALFLQLAQATHELEDHPRFYNTLTSNCTNELAKAANQVKSDAVPFNIALFLPGYSDRLLYDLGFIPNDAPLEQIRARYFITDLVVQDDGQPDFSERLRSDLRARAEAR